MIAHEHEENVPAFRQSQNAKVQPRPKFQVAPKRPDAKAAVLVRPAERTGGAGRAWLATTRGLWAAEGGSALPAAGAAGPGVPAGAVSRGAGVFRAASRSLIVSSRLDRGVGCG